MTIIKISAVQFSYKPIKLFKDFEENVENLVKKAEGSDITVFPEAFTLELQYLFPNYNVGRIYELTEEYLDLFSRLSKVYNQVIIAGSHIVLENDKRYNTGYIFYPDGQVKKHRKSHLMPYENKMGLIQGDSIDLFDIEDVKIGLAICYEIEFPELVRTLTLQGAKIIICPSYTIDEYGFWRVRHCCQARAIENQIYVVHSCLVGTSAIPGLVGWGKSSILSPCEAPWNPNGVIAEAEVNEEMVITGVLDLTLLEKKRKRGVAPTLNDRRPELYKL
jgi:predicted amidohydrolase